MDRMTDGILLGSGGGPGMICSGDAGPFDSLAVAPLLMPEEELVVTLIESGIVHPTAESSRPKATRTDSTQGASPSNSTSTSSSLALNR